MRYFVLHAKKGGYSNWKKAMEKGRGFQLRERCSYHCKAVTRYIVAPNAMGNSVDMTSREYAAERCVNRKMLIKILSNVRYLGIVYVCMLYIL